MTDSFTAFLIAGGTKVTSDKEKPLLHSVVGEVDQELYCEDLDWYFGCYDSECGLKSVQQAAEDMLRSGEMTTTAAHAEDDWEGNWDIKVSKSRVSTTHEFPYSDRHVRFSRGEGSFTRGRRIWNRLIRIPLGAQQLLESYYTARRNKGEFEQDDIRSAHRAYYR